MPYGVPQGAPGGPGQYGPGPYGPPPGPPARRNWTLVAVSVAVAAAVIGGVTWLAVDGDSDSDDSSGVGATAASTSAPAASDRAAAPPPNAPDANTADPNTPGTSPPGAVCAAPKAGSVTPMSFPAVPATTIDKTGSYSMNLATNCGAVVVRLDAAKAPVTVNSFAFLAGKNYFDHTKCHRLTTEGIFVLQCGDPTGTGSGGPGYEFADENLTGATYPAGTLAMANAGPGTNGSQFFLVYKDSQLPPSYTPFGTVTTGMDILLEIAAAGTEDGASDGAPSAGVVLDDMTVTKS